MLWQIIIGFNLKWGDLEIFISLEMKKNLVTVKLVGNVKVLASESMRERVIKILLDILKLYSVGMD